MEKINSFKLDHNTHKKGFYLSAVYGDIYTYDMRFKTPNGGDYLRNAAMHTVEHLFATVIRNSAIKDSVIYFGPMGCRTGFYLLLRNIEREEALKAVISALKDCLKEVSIPGSKKRECGNYRQHNLKDAKKEISEYLSSLSDAE